LKTGAKLGKSAKVETSGESTEPHDPNVVTEKGSGETVPGRKRQRRISRELILQHLQSSDSPKEESMVEIKAAVETNQVVKPRIVNTGMKPSNQEKTVSDPIPPTSVTLNKKKKPNLQPSCNLLKRAFSSMNPTS
jgi:hypothetical protein